MHTRYSRQEILPELGRSGQERLANSRVLVIGAGGLGCPILQYLAAAGVGTITVVDDDIVAESNLQRQVLFSSDEIGEKKVAVVKKRINALNPEVSIHAISERLQVANARTLIPECDLVLDGSDNFGTTYLINDACVEYGVPFISGSLFRFEGQVSLYNATHGPTYRCIYPEPPPAVEMPSCGDAGILGSVAGFIGCIMAQEALKFLAGFGTSLSGTLIISDLLNFSCKSISCVPTKAGKAARLKSQDYYDELNSCDTVPIISFSELEALKAENAVTLIDVREAYERSDGHIGGIHIPLGLLPEKINEVRLKQKVVFYCKSGQRSARAVSLLQATTASEVFYSLQGGMDANPTQLNIER